MSTEFWAMLAIGVAVVGLNWRMYATLRRDMNQMFKSLGDRLSAVEQRVNDIDRRLARIEGWIAGRFREEAV